MRGPLQAKRAAPHLGLIALLLLGGCGGPSVTAVDFGSFGPVAVATSPATVSEGVTRWPLAPGETLGFRWPKPVTPTWTMHGVDYDLTLYALDEQGEPVDSVKMDAGGCCYALPGKYAVYVEVRSGE